MKRIHINQLGYRPDDVKKAILPQEAASFRVCDYATKEEVFAGQAGEPVFHATSNETVRVADFSAVTQEGEYILTAALPNGEEASYPFEIKPRVYKRLRYALMEMLNYQKCGVDLECGLWSHPACHTSPATIYGTDKKKDVSGGWHDAGDYGRYIVPAAVTVADMLLAHELSPNPEDGLLETTWFEIAWMLKMQCEETGGVYHKVSCHNFNAMDEMPHEEHGELVLCPISLAATGDFAACMALASRFYPQEKERLLAAAKRAWAFCEQNRDMENFKNPPEVRTGNYGDFNNKDELFWAACELFAATGEDKYHQAIKASDIYTGFGWASVGSYGIISYLKAGENADAALYAKMKETLLADCEKIMKQCSADAYGIAMEKFMWGSNYTIANNARALLLAIPYAGEEKAAPYMEAALAHFHYLLGCNPLSQGYVSGFGANGMRNPHHRPSYSVGSAVPGMVAGGPNQNTRQDPAINAHCEGQPPAKCYIDHFASYAGNEITIYWNSPVYMIAAMLGF